MLSYKSYLEINPEDTYIIPLYSVPLIHLKLNDWENKKSILMETYEKVSSNPKSFREEGNTKYSVITDFHQTFEDEDFSTTEVIVKHFEEELQFISEVFNCYVDVNNSWFEKSSRNRQHPPHTHGNCGLSCVVFIKFDPKYHGPTIFIDPNLASDSPSAPLNQMPPGVREGSMIVFPSYLAHYTLPNQTDVDRIILSFNMSFDKCEGKVFEEEPVEEEYAVPSKCA